MHIDVHHHFNGPGSRYGRPDWSPQATVEAMDSAGVSMAMGWTGPVAGDTAAAARDRARLLNDFGAGITSTWPTRFGLFATLPPLQDVDGALREIAYAFDQLQADGIGLVTHYGDMWLGNPAFAPVWEELNRRQAVVFVHPGASSGACGCGAQGYQVEGVSDAWLEYPFHTARTILNLMVTGTLRRFPAIRFIFCHGGGAFTSLLSRLEGFTGWYDVGPDKLRELFPDGIAAEYQRMFFECAQAWAPQNMAQLRHLVPDTQLLFGTDYDRFPLQHSVAQFERLELAPEVRQAIAHGNARRLFTRLLA